MSDLLNCINEALVEPLLGKAVKVSVNAKSREHVTLTYSVSYDVSLLKRLSDGSGRGLSSDEVRERLVAAANILRLRVLEELEEFEARERDQ